MWSFKKLAREIYADVAQKQTLALAAGLSYYFVLSMFPLLILLAAIVSYIPVPDLFARIVNTLAAVIPEQSMGLVRAVLGDVIHAQRGSFLTVGILGVLWGASSGFASLISALNVAYDVPETRPFWKIRLLAILLTFVTGMLLIVGVFVLFLGPQFGAWLAGKIGAGYLFARLWPTLRWSISIAFIVAGVELIFLWAPNIRQRFLLSLPGAVVAAIFWISASYLMGLYFQHFAQFNKTYGTLGAAIALMVWLYWSWFIVLLGAQLNAQLLKTLSYDLPLKQPRQAPVPMQPLPAEQQLPEKEVRDRGAA